MTSSQTPISTSQSRISNAVKARRKVRRPDASSKRRLAFEFLEERVCLIRLSEFG